MTTSFITTPPTDSLLSLEEIKEHLRVVEEEDNASLLAVANEAMECVAAYCQCDLLTTTRIMLFDRFPHSIQFDVGPWQSVESIQYDDTNGDEQTLSTDVYKVDLFQGRVTLKSGQSWPSTYSETNAVRVVFKTGYATRHVVPHKLRGACKHWLRDLWDGIPEEEGKGIHTAKSMAASHARVGVR